MDFRIYRDHTGDWHWSLAADGRPFLDSSRAYPSEAACRQAIATLRQQVLAASAVRVAAGAGGYFAA